MLSVAVVQTVADAQCVSEVQLVALGEAMGETLPLMLGWRETEKEGLDEALLVGQG